MFAEFEESLQGSTVIQYLLMNEKDEVWSSTIGGNL